jgi:chromosome segregation ATPase
MGLVSGTLAAQERQLEDALERVSRLEAALSQTQTTLARTQTTLTEVTAERDKLRRAYEKLKEQLELPRRRIYAAKAARRAKPSELGKLELEMRVVEQEFVVLEESYSTNTLSLQLARGYLKALLGNARVAKYLGQKHVELLWQLRRVVEATSLEG